MNATTHNWTPKQLEFLRANAELPERDLAAAFRRRWRNVGAEQLADRAIARRRYVLLRADRRRQEWTDAQLAFLAQHADLPRAELVRAFRGAFRSAQRFLSTDAIVRRVRRVAA